MAATLSAQPLAKVPAFCNWEKALKSPNRLSGAPAQHCASSWVFRGLHCCRSTERGRRLSQQCIQSKGTSGQKVIQANGKVFNDAGSRDIVCKPVLALAVSTALCVTVHFAGASTAAAETQGGVTASLENSTCSLRCKVPSGPSECDSRGLLLYAGIEGDFPKYSAPPVGSHQSIALETSGQFNLASVQVASDAQPTLRTCLSSRVGQGDPVELKAVAAVAGASVAVTRSAAGIATAGAVSKAISSTAALVPPKALAAAVVKAVRHFVGGGIAGAIGATIVCPIDTVKTRLQGQATKKGEKKQYANSADCFLQILTKEGPGAFFSGLLPQVIGVAPEKAIKLTVNDLLMGVLESYVPGLRPWMLEPIAGSGGGMAQVLFTNPMEMVKIRQQMRRGGAPKSALAVVRELGVAGLYRGSAATLLRDIPYSAMFFGIYVYLKQAFPEQPFVAAGLAAVPAAFLCTPMDVVKTRIQMERSDGGEDMSYCETLAKIVKDEGPQALFAGGLERVLRTSPQFGITLSVYELLDRF